MKTLKDTVSSINSFAEQIETRNSRVDLSKVAGPQPRLALARLNFSPNPCRGPKPEPQPESKPEPQPEPSPAHTHPSPLPGSSASTPNPSPYPSPDPNPHPNPIPPQIIGINAFSLERMAGALDEYESEEDEEVCTTAGCAFNPTLTDPYH